ncbi:hypothetical protein [Roseivivax isoporae]|uniref:Uncharacterized protein n=1 Tax=Roseivivax isoporae LMG 25204 TaxID=1449351 RepID=X7FBD8_9RHOB|nr:hypothetical protein [Roseivivax isoporae]ETX29431.1 hypothetical protein RISW2_23130 [Roseivivax isoporae LMG 25204]
MKNREPAIEPTLTERVVAVEYMSSLMMRAVGNLSPAMTETLATAMETLAEAERETRPGVTTLLSEKAAMLRSRSRDQDRARAVGDGS